MTEAFEACEPYVLAVSNEDGWRRTVELKLGQSRAGFNVVRSVSEAVAKIESGEFTGVITDHLMGDWRLVAGAAQDSQLPVVVFSGDSVCLKAAEDEGLPTHKRWPLPRGVFGKMVKLMTPKPLQPDPPGQGVLF